jgi:hypothetical protein
VDGKSLDTMDTGVLQLIHSVVTMAGLLVQLTALKLTPSSVCPTQVRPAAHPASVGPRRARRPSRGDGYVASSRPISLADMHHVGCSSIPGLSPASDDDTESMPALTSSSSASHPPFDMRWAYIPGPQDGLASQRQGQDHCDTSELITSTAPGAAL